MTKRQKYRFFSSSQSFREQQTIDVERELRYEFMCERCQKEMPNERKFRRFVFVDRRETSFLFLVRSVVPDFVSTKAKESFDSEKIFFSIQQRIEAYKPKLIWKDMDHHIRLIAKDLRRTDFISSETKADDYNYGPLTRLLVTFAFYNPHIGYSQGQLKTKT